MSGPVVDAVRAVLSDPWIMGTWAALVGLSVAALWWDLRTRNRSLPSLMKAVWTLVVVYSGPAGVGLYWYAGRTQIDHDSRFRRGVRSTAHCYSGCGAGEVVGVLLAQGVLGLAVGRVAAVTFGCAYLFGTGLTVGPLLQEGVGLGEALRDAFYTETPSITVMEVVAIGSDFLLAAHASMTELLFWGSLALSLSLGFAAALPVNLTLVGLGVKEGMANPANLDGAAG